MNRLWDVVVGGAGPAGSRAAVLMAGRGAAVLLLDPKAPCEKPGGDGLTAAALEHTPELRELHSASQAIHEVVVTAPSGVSVVIPLRRPYRTISRLALSHWGLERAQTAGAEFRPVAVRSAERTNEGWFITDSAGDTHRAPCHPRLSLGPPPTGPPFDWSRGAAGDLPTRPLDPVSAGRGRRQRALSRPKDSTPGGRRASHNRRNRTPPPRPSPIASRSGRHRPRPDRIRTCDSGTSGSALAGDRATAEGEHDPLVPPGQVTIRRGHADRRHRAWKRLTPRQREGTA